MIIDSLTHVTPDGLWFNSQHDASLDRLLREMDKAGVDKGVVVALAGYIENEFVAHVCKQHADRLIPGASVNPIAYPTASKAAEVVRTLLEGEEFALLKLHPRLNGYDPLDERCLAVIEEVSSLSRAIPIWIDTLFRGNKCILRKSTIDTLHELATRFKDQQFVLLHGCGSEILGLAELVSAFENLTIDLSLTILYYELSSIARDIHFTVFKRDMNTVVGSDFPEYTQSQYVNRIRNIFEGNKYPQDKLDKVLGGNLFKILRLDES